MATPEARDKSEDYGYFTFGIVMLLIGIRFFVGEPATSQERLFTGSCLVLSVVIVATAPKYMWRFSSVCTSMMVFGAMSLLYAILVFVTGESGGPASQHTPRSTAIFPLVVGLLCIVLGAGFKAIYAVFKREV